MENITLDKKEIGVQGKEAKREEKEWENPDLLEDHGVEDDHTQTEDALENKKQEEVELKQVRNDIDEFTYKGEPIKPYDKWPKHNPHVYETPRTSLLGIILKKRQEEGEKKKENKFSFKAWFKKK